MSSSGVCTSQIEGGPVSTAVTSLLTFLLASHCSITKPSVWPSDYGPTALEKGLTPYDFVIVGGGISGSVVASRLTENPKTRVLLIESGDDPSSESEIPPMFLTMHNGPQTFKYETEDQVCPSTKNGKCLLQVARVMGGASSIDQVISLRGNKAKFDEWNLPTWSYDEVTEYYNLAEESQSTNGYLVDNPFDQYDTCHVTDMIYKGYRELGLKRLGVVDSNSKIGVGQVKGHLKKGQRMGAGKTYLSAAKSRPNLNVIKNADVTLLNMGKTNGQTVANSVTFILNGDVPMTAVATKEVILAAGTLGNAKLLMLSGIGPQSHLTAHGIPVIVDLPGVGQNFQDQVAVPIVFEHNKTEATPKTEEMSHIDLMYYLMERYGPLTTLGSAYLMGYINSGVSCKSKDCLYPDLSIINWFSQRNDKPVQMWSDAVGYKKAIAQSLQDVNEEANVLMMFVSLQNPKSKGHVELRSKSRLDNLKVNANFLSNNLDVESILQGFKFLMHMEETNAFTKGKATIVEIDTPCNQKFKSDDYWRCYIRYMISSMYAQSGTTKMGLDTDELAVVNLRMALKNVQNCRVVGSSIFPTTITSSNTDVMVAERLVKFLKEDHGL